MPRKLLGSAASSSSLAPVRCAVASPAVPQQRAAHVAATRKRGAARRAPLTDASSSASRLVRVRASGISYAQGDQMPLHGHASPSACLLPSRCRQRASVMRRVAAAEPNRSSSRTHERRLPFFVALQRRTADASGTADSERHGGLASTAAHRRAPSRPSAGPGSTALPRCERLSAASLRSQHRFKARRAARPQQHRGRSEWSSLGAVACGPGTRTLHPRGRRRRGELGGFVSAAQAKRRGDTLSSRLASPRRLPVAASSSKHLRRHR
ncbi:hypothetical protein FA09DRAFT_81484 [Tilletiopsis washingtonensis]|uniref:Uncharacterized protein n=1 Tax=Tilletiopsis washingtonensis TaxID=58919 RepID=A0A316Z4H5_9BASI|nr:hypothetical protein FA09DRAFT_81484 [Tilletiopsis washingtonensis]PWN96667.1 hypothetical protein FA09DRAFT_81484 [Tilletiopsis washingtonensis]